MKLRRYYPSILVGSGTVLADNPSLTARLENEVWCPLRLILDTRGVLAERGGLNVFAILMQTAQWFSLRRVENSGYSDLRATGGRHWLEFCRCRRAHSLE